MGRQCSSCAGEAKGSEEEQLAQPSPQQELIEKAQRTLRAQAAARSRGGLGWDKQQQQHMHIWEEDELNQLREQQQLQEEEEEAWWSPATTAFSALVLQPQQVRLPAGAPTRGAGRGSGTGANAASWGDVPHEIGTSSVLGLRSTGATFPWGSQKRQRVSDSQKGVSAAKVPSEKAARKAAALKEQRRTQAALAHAALKKR